MHTASERGDIPYLMINPIYYYSGEVPCVHGTPPPLPNIYHKIGYLANSFMIYMIYTFSASHQKYYCKGLLEEGSNRTSPTIKGRSSIPNHTFNFCDTWEENETQTHMKQIYLTPAHTGGWWGCCGGNQVTAGPERMIIFKLIISLLSLHCMFT